MSKASTILLLLALLPASHLAFSMQPAHDLLGDEDTPARIALRIFDVTKMYLPGSKHSHLPREYYELCEAKTPQACLDWVANNRQTVAQSLPNNPKYWPRFWDYLATGPLGANRFMNIGLLDDTMPGYQPFIEAVNIWHLPNWISQDRLDIDKTETVVHQLRAQWLKAPTLMDQQIILAAIGIVQDQLNLAMATSIRHQHNNEFDRLVKLIRPFTAEERSMRTALTGELVYGHGQISTMPTNLEEARELHLLQAQAWRDSDIKIPFPSAEHLTQKDIDTERLELEADVNYITQLYSELINMSESTAKNYWRFGTEIYANLEKLKKQDKYDSQESYLGYLHEQFKRDLYNYVLLALAASYSGDAPIQSPNTPAPAHWQWDWREKSQSLCLIPKSVHASVLKSDDEVCLPYLKIP